MRHTTTYELNNGSGPIRGCRSPRLQSSRRRRVSFKRSHPLWNRQTRRSDGTDPVQQSDAGLHQVVETMQQDIGLQLGGRDFGVAEVDQDQGRAGRSRSAGIRLRIANHDGARQVPAHGRHGLNQMGGVGLDRRDGVNAHHAVEQVRHTELRQQATREVSGLVRADDQLRARCFQCQGHFNFPHPRQSKFPHPVVNPRCRWFE